MNAYQNVLRLFVSVVMGCSMTSVAAQPIAGNSTKNPVVERAKKEAEVPSNYFAIAFYQPTYILPYYYTGTPDNAVYANNTPNNEQLKHAEFKYQFSVKVPIWKNILGNPSSLYIAYTQLSYWQLYAHSAFFRESDYEPEMLLEHAVNRTLIRNWKLDFLNLGVMHQSNGYGGNLERAWDRAYFDAITSVNNLMIDIKPWIILHRNANNENIATYMGYGQIVFSYKYHQQVFSLRAYNVVESGGRRPSAEVAWSFPITPYIKGYLQVFSGYGQSLIEFNHHTNSAGIGIALSDWV